MGSAYPEGTPLPLTATLSLLIDVLRHSRELEKTQANAGPK